MKKYLMALNYLNIIINISKSFFGKNFQDNDVLFILLNINLIEVIKTNIFDDLIPKMVMLHLKEMKVCL